VESAPWTDYSPAPIMLSAFLIADVFAAARPVGLHL
jgi:hypothetical protein